MKLEEMKYQRVNIDKLTKKVNALLDEFNNAESFETQDKVFNKLNKVFDDAASDYTLISIHYTCDTNNEKYVADQEDASTTEPLLSDLAQKMNKALIASKFKDQYIEKYGEHLFKMIEASLKSFSPEVIDELQKINLLVNKYDALIASAKIEFNGETYNLSQMAKFAQSFDRNVRRGAALKAAKFFEDNDQELGDIYDQLVKLRTQMAKKLGFNNYVELGYLRLGRTDYNAQDIALYRDEIYKHIVPITNKYFLEQKERICVENPQYYDFNVEFKNGNPAPKGDVHTLVNKAQEMYHQLSKTTDEFFAFLRENHLMDLEARKGKVGGGYMTFIPRYKSPFIFANFNGTLSDVNTLTHEFGHALQGYLTRNFKISDYRSPTLEACEIHSTSMELFTYPWMDLFFGEDVEKYRYQNLKDELCFIPYGTVIDEFQHFVYEHPEISHEERCQAYKRIEEKYLPHKKYDDCEIYSRGRFWLKQGHVFSTPFYYIDYTLAHLCAFQFFTLDLKNHEKAWNKYLRFSKMGGKYGFRELLAKAHLLNPLDQGNIKKIIKPIENYLDEFKLPNE